MQNGQTEPAGGTRRRTCVRREAKFVRNIKKFNYKIGYLTNFCLSVNLFLVFFMWYAHFITARYAKMLHVFDVKILGGIVFDIIKDFGGGVKHFVKVQ